MDTVDMGEPLGIVYRPWLGGLDHFDDDNEDHWDVIYSQEHTNGVHERAIVGVYTDEVNHAILEKDPDIIRVDDKKEKPGLEIKDMAEKIGISNATSVDSLVKTVNPYFDERVINLLGVAR